MPQKPRTTLPLLAELQRKASTDAPVHLERARKQLGGRVAGGRGAGRLVSVDAQTGRLPGVVLFDSGTEVDVWIDAGMVRRVRPERVHGHTEPMPEHLRDIAADAEVFGRLVEGQRVTWQTPAGERTAGLLIEKYRYGALIAQDDGSMVALGFRKVFPATTS